MAFAAPTSTSELTYFPGQTTHFAQGADVSFAARAPPMEGFNVAVTGGVTGMYGSAFALHRHETVVVLFGFGADHNAPNTGLGRSQVDEIVGTPKGQRPDPSDYMSQAEIDAHLARFDGGAVRFASADDVAKYGTAGPPNGGFVMPKSEFDGLVREAGGDLRVVERRLGLDNGSLSSGNTVALEIKPQDMNGLRVPSGNEGGANSQWVPGGYTSGGVPEAVMDFSGVPYTPIEF